MLPWAWFCIEGNSQRQSDLLQSRARAKTHHGPLSGSLVGTGGLLPPSSCYSPLLTFYSDRKSSFVWISTPLHHNITSLILNKSHIAKVIYFLWPLVGLGRVPNLAKEMRHEASKWELLGRTARMVWEKAECLEPQQPTHTWRDLAWGEQ